MAWIWLGSAIFLAYGIEAMTGFGSIVLALSMGALVFDLQSLVPMMVTLNILMTAPLTFRHRQHIQWPLLLRRVLPLMLAGTAVGVYLSPLVPAVWSKLLFALLIVWFSARAIRHTQAPQLQPVRRDITIAGAGITHGLFASGGPLLVYAIARLGLNKAQFRATLLTVWLTLNSGMTLWFLSRGVLAQQAHNILLMVPCVIAGALLGNALHHKINEAHFLRVVFTLLLLVGLLLAGTSLRTLLQ